MSGSVAVRWSYVNQGGQNLLKRLVALRELPRENQEADLRWGKPANFLRLVSGGVEVPEQPTLIVIWPENSEEEETEQEPPPLVYNEESRVVETIRVENPDDSEQYVDVERITSIVFRGGDGRRHQFNLDHGD